MRARIMFIAAALALFGVFSTPAYAHWYAYGIISTGSASNGFEVDISTPAAYPSPGADSPTMPLNRRAGLSNSIGTTAIGGKWFQTGWWFYKGDTLPTIYVEYFDLNKDHQFLITTGSWNQVRTYRVQFLTNPSRWCAFVNGVNTMCGSYTVSGTTSGLIQSEIHFNPQVPLNTGYGNLKYIQASNGTTAPAILNQVTSQFPYKLLPSGGNYLASREAIVSLNTVPIAPKP